jgi:hypothetical protein
MFGAECCATTCSSNGDYGMAPFGLKEAITTCKAEMAAPVARPSQPGQDRIAACLFANRSTASKACGEVLGKIEAMAR